MKPTTNFRLLLVFLAIFLFNKTSYSQTTIFDYTTSWKYSNGAATPANDGEGDAWYESDYDDAAWSSNSALFHVGESGGTDLGTLRTTTYFRKTFTLTNPSATYITFDINLVRDDGAIVYLNGVEVASSNMPGGPYTFSTNASGSINGGNEGNIHTYNIPVASFLNGSNTIAVEVHQASTTGSDMRFQMNLSANAIPVPVLSRGPYLQMANETAITIRWRTNIASDSKVELGTSLGTYPIVVTDATSTTEHIIRVTGLTADTKYFYRIGSTTLALQGASDNFFTTVPPGNTTRKIRIAAFGDCGRNSSTYQDENLTNYRNFLTTNSIEAPDAWILMGDNAYSSGTDAEYSSNFFGIYGNTLLKNHKLYPAPGNHDYANNTANKPSRAMPYYSNFTIPQNAECGGIASTKPNFYSFDIGNIHFLSLDSWGTETDLTHMGTSGSSTLKTWINNDLAANTKKWVIAYWHHPPYTKTSHNSDTETELVNIRQNFITYLESRGVDLIISGHSHGYERGYLLKNFTLAWNQFVPATHAVSTSSATYTSNSTCPYVYNSTPLNHGTVYVVAGSSGASGGIQTDFNAYAFPYSVNDGGVFYFEVEDNRLDAKMLRRNGTVFDQFTIMKDVNRTSTYNIANGSSITLTASWPSTSNYSWSNAATTRSITVTPPIGTSNYTVTDNFGCITDNITVNALVNLDVHLTKYQVYLNKEKVNIDWTTASELNSNYFTVERSVDGADFQPLVKVNASGNSSSAKNYSAIDNRPMGGTSYYRLTQTDIDGKVKLFDIKKIINTRGKSFDVKLLVTGNTLNVSLLSTQHNRVNLRIYDMVGRTINSKSWNINSGSTQVELRLTKGSYILSFMAGNEKVVQKIVID